MKKEKLEITIYKAISQELIAEWKNMWEKSPSACVFNSPGWFISAQKAFKYKNKRFIVIRNKKSKKLEGIVPLVSTYEYGLRTYVLPGHKFIDHYTFLIDVKNKEDWKNVIRKILTIGTIHISGLIRKDAKYIFPFKNVEMFLADKNPYIIFDNDYKEYLAENTFKRLSRKFLKVEKDLGSVEFDFQLPVKRGTIEKIILLDQKSSRAAKGKSAFDKRENRIFYRSLYKENSKSIFVSFLYFNNECVAYNAGFSRKDIYSGSQKAHLQKYNKYSPGVLIFEKLLENISQNNPQEFDLGGGSDQFKMKYAKSVRDIYGVVFAKNIFKGRYLVFMHKLRRRAYDTLSSQPVVYKYYKKITNFSWLKRNALKARSES